MIKQQQKPLFQEPYRPQYHFSVPKHWSGDVNGLLWFMGEYHFFYQYNPNGNTFGNCSWGHSVSNDLLHWKQLPPAILYTKEALMFSGSVIADSEDCSGLFGGKPGMVAYYTSHRLQDNFQQIEMAFSGDKGRTWTRYSRNPIFPGSYHPAWVDFRDPFIFRYGQKWILIVGGGYFGSMKLLT